MGIVSGVVATLSRFVLRRLWVLTGTLDPLLTETNQFDGVALLGEYRMTFRLMSWRSLRFIISRKPFTSVFDGHFLPLYLESFFPVFL